MAPEVPFCVRTSRRGLGILIACSSAPPNAHSAGGIDYVGFVADIASADRRFARPFLYGGTASGASSSGRDLSRWLAMPSLCARLGGVGRAVSPGRRWLMYGCIWCIRCSDVFDGDLARQGVLRGLAALENIPAGSEAPPSITSCPRPIAPERIPSARAGRVSGCLVAGSRLQSVLAPRHRPTRWR